VLIIAPYEHGPINNNGCPEQDSDGDGILDQYDNCPKKYGPTSNKGCPETNAGTFIDSRDGQMYTWKRMKDGKKWMTQNLNYERPGSYCYDNKEKNCTDYGRLYVWRNALNICPKGWHLPTDNDWKNLLSAYGGYYDSAKRKEVGSSQTAYKSLMSVNSGFNPSLGGERNMDYGFMALASVASYWSATQSDSEISAWYYSFSSDKIILRFRVNKNYAISCRCIME